MSSSSHTIINIEDTTSIDTITDESTQNTNLQNEAPSPSMNNDDDTRKPSTSSKDRPESNKDPLNIVELLRTDSLLKSLEDLSETLKNQQEQLLKEFTVSETLIHKEVGVGSDNIFRLNFQIPEDPNYPPPPYSFDGTVSQHVYLQQTSPQYRQPAPSYDFVINSFDSVDIRNKFVTKVYAILFVQLLITMGFIATCVFVEPVKHFVMTKSSLFLLSTISMFMLLMLLACFVSLRRMFPMNFVLLLLLTLCLSYTVGAMACYYSQKALLYATAATATIVGLVTFLAWLNICDVTSWEAIIYIGFVFAVLLGIVVSIVNMVLGGSEVLNLLFASVVVVLFTVYLLYDTQKIMGGGRLTLSPEEYILGALSLYVDIMLIFNYILLFFGRR